MNMFLILYKLIKHSIHSIKFFLYVLKVNKFKNSFVSSIPICLLMDKLLLLINTSSQSFGDGYFSGCQTFGTLNPVENQLTYLETDILPSGKTTIDVTHITTTQSKLEL